MKKYLLDTHAFIWAITDDDQLSKSVLNLLQDKSSVLFVSVVSFWELAIKLQKGKLYLEDFQIQNLSFYCQKLGITQIPLTPKDAFDFIKFPFDENHKDPFDRMLVCQCVAHGYTLVSKDAKMAAYRENGLECVW